MTGETPPTHLPTDGALASFSTPTIMGVDVGGTSIKWSIVSGSTIESSGSLETPRSGHEAVLHAVGELVRAAGPRISGIGIAVPGTVDSRTRTSVFLPNLPGDWTDLPVADQIEQRSGLPVALLNDARAFAWAELSHGAARAANGAVFVTLGTGVGGAIAYQGRVLMGLIDAIGELGHVSVDPDGEYCPCGGVGCLETVASATAIVAHVARPLAMQQSPTLRTLISDSTSSVTAEHVAEAARRGDPWALDAFHRAGTALGRVVATAALLLQLDTVVVGGGLRRASDLLLPEIQQELDRRTSMTGAISVLTSHFGAEAGSVGAAVYAATRLEHARTSVTEGNRE